MRGRTYTYERVLDCIQAMVDSGEIRQGDRLPTERNLAARFGVSRHVVRQALQTLGERGIVIRRQGDGTYLSDSPMESLAPLFAAHLLGNGSRVDEILEMRMVLEPGIAALAATRVDPAGIRRLTALVCEQERAFENGEAGDRADAAFHLALAGVTGNRVLAEAMHALSDLFDESRTIGLVSEKRYRRSIDGHRLILKALLAKDAKGAQAAMVRHLADIREGVSGKRIDTRKEGLE